MSITRCKYCEYEHDTDYEAEHEEECREEVLASTMADKTLELSLEMTGEPLDGDEVDSFIVLYKMKLNELMGNE